jgi:hypothetical protein
MLKSGPNQCQIKTLPPKVWGWGLRFRQLRPIPPATQRNDQIHRGSHSSAQNIDVIHLVIQRSRLSRNHLQKRIDSTDITVIEDPFRFQRSRSRTMLFRGFIGQHMQRNEIIFNLLKRHENTLLVCS